MDFEILTRISGSYALVRPASGYIVEAELHWYEASGIGRREIKIKRLFQGWP